MKKLIALFAATLLLVFGLFACKEGDPAESSQGEKSGASYASKTAAFYSDMNKSSFYFKMNFTQNGETCVFTQLTNGKTTTTLKDYEDNSKDIYDIFDGQIIHHIVVDQKLVNSTMTPNGQAFLFADYTPSMFASPDSTGDSEFNGKTYYSETFETASKAGGAIDGKNVYFFEGDKLVAVEIYESSEKTMVMEFLEYSNSLPSDIYLEAPADYSKGNIEIEVSADFSAPSEWWE